MMSASPPECDIVPALTPPPPKTRCRLAMVAVDTTSWPRTAANSPTAQWTAAGGRGLLLGRAPSPVGRGFSCQSEPVIAPPPNMAADCVTDRRLGAASARVPVLSMGSGLGGPVGGSVPLPVSHKAVLPRGLATAPALTPPLHPAHLAVVAVVMTGRQKTATRFLTAQWMEPGGPGPPSLPVLLPVGWGSRCRPGDVTAPPPNMAAGRVPERDAGRARVRPTSTAQWMGCGQSGRHGNRVNTRSARGTFAANS